MTRPMHRTPKASFHGLLLLAAIAACGWLYAQPKPEPNSETDDADTPFHNAENGNLKALMKQVSNDRKILQRKHITGMTVLHYAAMGNQAEVIRFVVKQGVKVDQLDETGSRTPLYWAAMSGKTHAVKSGRVLIEFGADPEWRSGGKKPPTPFSTLRHKGATPVS